MAGLYIHIPFCISKCIYCDFYSVVGWKNSLVASYLSALEKEIRLRADTINERIDTVYFGGGTPSVIRPKDLQKILEIMRMKFSFASDPEITIEINPDDFSEEYAKELKNDTEFNRISFGIQSFIDRDLKFLGRRHDAFTAKSALERAKKLGYDNISIDLIFCLPGSGLKQLRKNLELVIDYDIPHVSAYNLTVEPGTKLWQLVRKKEIQMPSEEVCAQQYMFLIEYLESKGFLHYEISNFAKRGYVSRHNFSYWIGKPYLGFGPSAHSFDGEKRCWNPANLHLYVRQMSEGRLKPECEVLSERDKFNEYIMTRLRIYTGISFKEMERQWPEYLRQIKGILDDYIAQGYLQTNGQNCNLTTKGKLIADKIISDLFILK
jgi:oxygen-independent coproporphyrinogen-3 oxidase